MISTLILNYFILIYFIFSHFLNTFSIFIVTFSRIFAQFILTFDNFGTLFYLIWFLSENIGLDLARIGLICTFILIFLWLISWSRDHWWSSIISDSIDHEIILFFCFFAPKIALLFRFLCDFYDHLYPDRSLPSRSRILRVENSRRRLEWRSHETRIRVYISYFCTLFHFLMWLFFALFSFFALRFIEFIFYFW